MVDRRGKKGRNKGRTRGGIWMGIRKRLKGRKKGLEEAGLMIKGVRERKRMVSRRIYIEEKIRKV